jgi:hypothetical protein
MCPEFLIDNSPYHDFLLKDLGSYTMSQGITYPTILGDTISHLASSALSIMGHELGHSFGFYHCGVNTRPWRGDIMSTSAGAVGIRGWAWPDLYPNNYSMLWRGYALALNVNRFFNTERVWNDNAPPILMTQIIEQVAGTPGHVGYAFKADDPSGLACAWLLISTDPNSFSVAYDALVGTSVLGTIETQEFSGGNILIIDNQSNYTTSGVHTSTWDGTFAPIPRVFISPFSLSINNTILLDASLSEDTNFAMTTAEWDIDGDGIFDTAPTTEKFVEVSYSLFGPKLIYVRLTNPEGRSSVSAPIPLRVMLSIDPASGLIAR